MSLSVSPHNFRYATVGCNKIALYIVVLLVQKNIEGGKTNNETPVLYAMLHAPKGVCKGVVAPPPLYGIKSLSTAVAERGPAYEYTGMHFAGNPNLLGGESPGPIIMSPHIHTICPLAKMSGLNTRMNIPPTLQSWTFLGICKGRRSLEHLSDSFCQ